MLDRRQLLTRFSAAALFLNGHGSAAWAQGEQNAPLEPPAQPSGEIAPRLLGLNLVTTSPVSDMKHFYGEKLGLPILFEEDKELVVQAGGTEIRFTYTSEANAAPFYHFAFNIPQNKILAARKWQLERTPLFITPENLRDPSFPDDVRHFRRWNAHSVFFWDPAGNVLEYIARHDLGNSADGPFSSEDIHYASEIAFVVDDVPGTATVVQTRFELDQYGWGGEPFWAIGDERGLLLLFKRGRQIGDRLRDRPAPVDVFPTRVEIRGDPVGVFDFPGYPYAIRVLE